MPAVVLTRQANDTSVLIFLRVRKQHACPLTRARCAPTAGRAAFGVNGFPVVTSYQSSKGTTPRPLEAYLTTEDISRSRVAVSVAKAAVHNSQPTDREIGYQYQE